MKFTRGPVLLIRDFDLDSDEVRDSQISNEHDSSGFYVVGSWVGLIDYRFD